MATSDYLISPQTLLQQQAYWANNTTIQFNSILTGAFMPSMAPALDTTPLLLLLEEDV